MRFSELQGKNIAILGCGREGRAAAKVLTKMISNARLTVVEEIAENAFAAENFAVEHGADFLCGTPGTINWSQFDVLVKSPGISLYRPDLVAEQATALKITSLTSIWLAENPDVFTIGITGTKGKSTTASMLKTVLSAAGRSVVLRGNVGRPLFDEENPESLVEIVILELSSFQLADISGRLNCGLITNLRPAHIDWHEGLENYYQDKLRLAEISDTLFAFADDPELRKRLQDHEVTWFAQQPEVFVDDHGLIEAGTIRIRPHEMIAPGWHNLLNACAAFSVASSLGVESEVVSKALKSFEPLPHRLEPVAEIHSRYFVNDSIATTPFATIAALRSFQEKFVQLIVGGADRGISLDGLLRAAANHPKKCRMVCTGEIGPRVFDEAKKSHPGLKVELIGDFSTAVRNCWTNSKAGDVILMSPAAPSFDSFRNFEERGERFRSIVASLRAHAHDASHQNET